MRTRTLIVTGTENGGRPFFRLLKGGVYRRSDGAYSRGRFLPRAWILLSISRYATISSSVMSERSLSSSSACSTEVPTTGAKIVVRTFGIEGAKAVLRGDIPRCRRRSGDTWTGAVGFVDELRHNGVLSSPSREILGKPFP